ncbi:MAG: helix-turn-helix transcriptional regulator [Saprospiraceae bacterium]|nr:helix-turn-helix transcriptional regulator [Saprospiraceae bacterium]
MKALTARSFTDVVREMKVYRAKELLTNTDKSIGEIAFDLGFKDASYFGKVFKETIGMGPREFRV